MKLQKKSKFSLFCPSSVTSFSLLTLTGCQLLGGNKSANAEREAAARAAYSLSKLEIEKIPFGGLESLRKDLTERLSLYSQGVEYLESIIRLYEGADEKTYQMSLDKIKREINILQVNCLRLSILTPNGWKKEKHFLEEQYHNLQTYFNTLYLKLI